MERWGEAAALGCFFFLFWLPKLARLPRPAARAPWLRPGMPGSPPAPPLLCSRRTMSELGLPLLPFSSPPLAEETAGEDL